LKTCSEEGQGKCWFCIFLERDNKPIYKQNEKSTKLPRAGYQIFKNGADFGAKGEAIFLTFAHGWDKCFSKMTLENATFPKECKIVTFPTRSDRIVFF